LYFLNPSALWIIIASSEVEAYGQILCTKYTNLLTDQPNSYFLYLSKGPTDYYSIVSREGLYEIGPYLEAYVWSFKTLWIIVTPREGSLRHIGSHIGQGPTNYYWVKKRPYDI